MGQQPLRMLLADDEASLREPLAKYLRQTYGYVVDTAADGQEVLHWLEQAGDQYDVALLDDVLIPAPGQEPRSLGVTLTREIKARFPRIEIIIFTGWGMASALEALRAGAYRYLAKPFNPEELGLLIQTAAEHSRLKEVAREKQILEQLMETSTALLSGRSLPAVLATILHGVQAIGFDRVRLYLLSADGQVMVGRAQAGMEVDFVGLELPVADDIYLQALLTDPHPQVFEREADRPLPYEQQLAKEEINQWACVPLLLHGKVIGKLSMDNKFSRRPIVPAELGPVAMFASQAAAAIENARLRTEEQKATQKAEWRARNLATVQEISTAISSLMELDQILEATCRAAVELFDVDHSGLVLFEEPNCEWGQVVAEYPGIGTRGLEIPVRGVPAEEQLIASQAPLILSDVSGESSLGPVRDIFDEFDIRSILIVPVVFKGRVLGSFSLDAIGRSRAFTQDEVELCQTFAAQVAVAVENVRLFAETKQRADQLDTLRRMTLAITSQLDRKTLLKTIIQQAVTLLGAKSGGIYEYYPERDELTIIADYGRLDDVGGNTLKVGEGMAGRLVQSGEPCIIVDDYNQWPGRADIYAGKHLFGAVIEVPLKWQERIIGVLYVDDEAGRRFTPEDADLLRLFADHATIALVNAELVTRDTDKLRRLEKLARASSELMGNLGGMLLDQRLNLITKYATEILEAETCGIFLVKRTGFLSLEASYGDQEESFEKGREFAIRSGPQTGLTGHIAYEGKLFNAHGDDLTGHFAVTGELSHTASRHCYSLLAIPLKNRNGAKEKLIGLLRVDNKKDRNGQAGPMVGFRREDEWILSLFADAVVVAIEAAELVAQLSEQTDHLAQLVKITERRGQLLTALDQASRHIRAEKETFKLLQEVVRLAAELVGCTAGGLYLNRPQLKELELHITYELPSELLGHRLPHAKGLAGLVARTGQSQVITDYLGWPDREHNFEAYSFKTVVGVPLKQAGEVEAVLFVADRTELRQLTEADLEILERFAEQASIALQTSRLMSQEQRIFAPLAILHKISDYIQAAGDLDKILHVVLTGVTAGYGLGFNRAALLLLDERREDLAGRMGIGHLDETKAREDWVRDQKEGVYDFRKYLDLLEQDALSRTPMDERIRGLQLPIESAVVDVFSQAVLERHPILVTQDQLTGLSDSFVEAFEPALPLVVVPLVTRDEVIGLLVADNKFTRSPITPEDIESLLTFANTAAIAIDNTQLFHEAKVARERLRSFYEASNALVSSRIPEQMLQDIVEQACVAADASGVSMILIDHTGRARYLVAVGTDEQFDINEVIRPNGLSMQVIREGKPKIIGDTTEQRDRINPSVFRRGIAAALGLPVSLEGKRIGVMWVHYDRPRHFSEHEIDSMQLYVNQAAIAYDSARRIKELEHMRQAAEALAGAAGLQEVLEQIVQGAQEVLEADSAVIWSYDAVRARFILANSVAAGIPVELWTEFRKEGPRRGGTADTIMERGWVGVTDVDDLQQYGFLGKSTRKLLAQTGGQSFQGIALTVGEETLGVLYVNYNRPRTFSEEEQETAWTFANHAALALKKAKLLDEVSKARNAAQVVAEITALEDLQSTLGSIVKRTRDVLGCDTVTLYTYDQDRGEFGFPPAMVGVKHRGKVLEAGKVIAQSVVHNILVLDDLHDTDNTVTDSLMNGPFVEREGIVSSAGIPLVVRGCKVGVMFVNYRTQHRFTDDELTNIRLFAHQAAVAIRNAQLYEQVQSRARLLGAAAKVARGATSILDEDQLLGEVVHLIVDCFGFFYHAGVFLLDNDREYAVLRAASSEGGQRMLQREHKLKVGKQGIVGFVTDTGKPRLTPDVKKDLHHFHNHDLPDTRAEMAFPLIVRGQVIGALDVQSTEVVYLQNEDIATLQTMADQLANAIQNAQLYQQATGRLAETNALQQVAVSLAGASELEVVLNLVMTEAMKLTKTHEGSILLWDAQAEGFTQMFRTDSEGILQPYRSQARIKEGIARTIINERKPVVISDAQQDPRVNPVFIEKGYRATLGVPLLSQQEVIGVLYVRSKEPRQFSKRQVALLEALASQAAVAIDRARQYEEMKKIKGYIGSSTAVDWIKMVSTAWGHSIRREVGTALGRVELLRSLLTGEQSTPEVGQELKQLENVISGIRDIPITAPLSYENAINSVKINESVRTYLDRRWHHNRYKSVKLNYNLQENLDDIATVRASGEWLRRGFEIVIDNAVYAMEVAKTPNKQITVTTRLTEDNKIEISFQDTGPGIPKTISNKLFKQPIDKPKGSTGAGIGLMLAQTIFQTYRGDIYVESTGKGGTNMVIILPIKN